MMTSVGARRLRLFHVDGGFVGPPLLDEKPGIPMVGVGQSRVELQGAEVLGLGPLPIAVVGLQGEGQGQMGVRPALVDGQGLGGGFLGLGEDDVGHFPAVIAAEVVGIGQGGLARGRRFRRRGTALRKRSIASRHCFSCRCASRGSPWR